MSSDPKKCYKLARYLTREYGFCCFPTKNKKTFRSWKNVHETVFDDAWTQANGCAIRTGKESQVTVIDVDNKGDTMAVFDRFVKHYKIKPTTWVLTPSGGYHLYFKWTPDLKQGNFGKEIDIDIRNDGGYIMAPASPYFADGEKSKYNGQHYEFKKDGDTLFDFDKLREVDPEFIKLYRYGINPKTMEFRETLRKDVPLTKKQRKREVAGVNKKLFVDLMKAYTKDVGNAYEQWIRGVWAVCGVCKKYHWDAEEIAIAWSSQVPNYEGPAGIRTKVREWDPKRGTFDMDYILRLVSDASRDAFAKFRRVYCYSDYMQIFKAPVVDIAVVKQYIQDSFVRIDRNSNVLWYIKASDGTWHSAANLFRDNPCAFTYKIPNPKYKPNDVKCKEPEVLTVGTTMAKILKANYLTWVPNYDDLQFLPFYGGKDPAPLRTFNTFTHYRHDVLDNFDEKDEDFQFVINHWLKYMCNGNQEFFDYLMNWIAWLIRFGYEKPKTAIVMHGTQGIGKGLMWIELLWKGVLGDKLGQSVQGLEKFTGRFNMLRLGKSIHIFDECTALNRNNKVNWDAMKAVITDVWFRVEPKGKESFQGRDCAGCVLLSNHTSCVDIPNRDRRYAIIETAKENPPQSYYTRLVDLVKSTRIQRSFFTYLVNRDLSKYNYRKIPNTDSRVVAQDSRNENRILHFLSDLVNDRIPARGFQDKPWFNTKYNETEFKRKQRWYSEQRVYDEYIHYLNREGVNQRYHPCKSKLTQKLKSHGLSRRYVTDRSFVYRDPTITRKQVWCYQLDKDIVRDINRAMRGDKTWDFAKPL